MSVSDLLTRRFADQIMPTLFDRLTSVAHSPVASLVKATGGGCYLLASNTVSNNIERLTQALKSEYSNARVAYSYKTNYEQVFVNEAMASGAYSEVVSSTEWHYAKRLGVPDADIIVNGAGKSKEFITLVLGTRATLIIDSLGEFEQVVAACKQSKPHARLGLRVAAKLPFIRTPTRFGIDLEDSQCLKKTMALLEELPVPVSGLHMHHSGDRSLAAFQSRLDYLIQKTSDLSLEKLTFIDIGGGLASAIPIGLASRLDYETSSLEEYGLALAKTMVSVFPGRNVELILEPGTGVLADAGAYLAPVLDTKDTESGHVSIIDGTLFCIDPLRSPVAPIVHIYSQGKHADPGSTRVCGNSCMEIDVIHPKLKCQPSTGDLLLIAQKGAYAGCMSSPFIQGLPAVVTVDQNNKFEVVRQRNSPHPLTESRQ